MTLLIPDDKSYFINNNWFFSFSLRNNGDTFNIKPNMFVCLVVFNATFNNISVIDGYLNLCFNCHCFNIFLRWVTIIIVYSEMCLTRAMNKTEVCINRGDTFNIKPNMFVCLVVFNATFNNISVISWRSVLLVEETGGPGENHRPVASH
jgi:nucleoside-specific outer membrane channel protein Tsx